MSQFLLLHNLGIFSCKGYKHNFSKTEMFTSYVQFSYLDRGVRGKLSRLVYLPSIPTPPRPGFGSGSVHFFLAGGGRDKPHMTACPLPLVNT